MMKIPVVISISVYLLIASATSSDQLVINEVLYDSPGSDTGCFVELMGKPGLNLDGYFVVGVNGVGGKEYNSIDLSGYSIPVDGYFVIAQDEGVPNADLVTTKANYQNSPDNIELWKEDEKLDSVGYGDFSDAQFTGEGSPTFDLANYSIGRRPDGSDTDDNSIDFVGLPLASPGEPNGPVTAVTKSRRQISNWGRIKNVKEK